MLRRREFLASAAAVASAQSQVRPNILWITFEDCSPRLGCYGDKVARTPAIDALARESVRFTHAFAAAPVCSAARSCLITGCDQTRTGLHQHRSRIRIPEEIRGFPALLRNAGYFTTNNAKTDYNVEDQTGFLRDCWDLSSRKAHWRARPKGRPFFSVFNFEITHQSRTCAWPYERFEQMIAEHLKPGERTSPADVSVPPFYPDTPIVRRTLAREYDCIRALDRSYVAPLLRELEEDGIAEDTIVFLFSDHGSGLPRGKRTLYDSGMRVPLLVRVPKKYAKLAPGAAGSVNDDLVTFADFAPTVLNMAGIATPAWMDGVSFAPRSGKREDVFGARDRIDEAFDFSRSVREKRWLYVRNFHPHVPLSQPERYSREEEIRADIAHAAAGGKLSGAALAFTTERPAEELYDTIADPHQTRNLAADRAAQNELRRMRTKLMGRMIRDLGLLPEELLFEMNRQEGPPVATRKLDLRGPLEMAARIGDPAQLSVAVKGLKDSSVAVRFWAVVCLRVLVRSAGSARAALTTALGDESACVRLEAASTLGALDSELPRRVLDVLASELDGANLVAATRAARILWSFGERARPVASRVRASLDGLAAREKQQPAMAPYFYALRAALSDTVDVLGKAA